VSGDAVAGQAEALPDLLVRFAEAESPGDLFPLGGDVACVHQPVERLLSPLPPTLWPHGVPFLAASPESAGAPRGPRQSALGRDPLGRGGGGGGGGGGRRPPPPPPPQVPAS
jgi:hypothetical protein